MWLVAAGEESVIKEACEVLEVCFSGVLVPICLKGTIDESFPDSGGVGGEGWYVEEEVHRFLVGFCFGVSLFVDFDGDVEEVDLLADFFEIPL